MLGLGPSSPAAPGSRTRIRALEAEGRGDDALLVAAAFARLEPSSPARGEVLRLAAQLVEAAPAKKKGAGPGGPTP